jgi:hypothetical protein
MTNSMVSVAQWGTYAAPASKKCADLLEDPVRPVLREAGDTYDMGGGYFLYDTCGEDLLAIDPKTHKPRAVEEHEYTVDHLIRRSTQRHLQRETTAADTANAQASVYKSVDPQGEFANDQGTYACGQERASLVWLNLESVRTAIHVQTFAESGRKFDFSTGLHYEFTAHSLLDLYAKTLVPNVRIMQYSGDADPCVPYVGTERWIASLGLDVSVPWRPWQNPNGNGVAGYVTTYKAGTSKVAWKEGRVEEWTSERRGGACSV